MSVVVEVLQSMKEFIEQVPGETIDMCHFSMDQWWHRLSASSLA